MGALIISDPNPSDFQVVVLVVAFCFSSGDTFKRSSKLVIFASAEGGKRGGGEADTQTGSLQQQLRQHVRKRE